MLGNALYAALTGRRDLSGGLGGGYLGSQLRGASMAKGNQNEPTKPIAAEIPTYSADKDPNYNFSSSGLTNEKKRSELYQQLKQFQQGDPDVAPRFSSRIRSAREQILEEPGGQAVDMYHQNNVDIANSAYTLASPMFAASGQGVAGYNGFKDTANYLTQMESMGYLPSAALRDVATQNREFWAEQNHPDFWKNVSNSGSGSYSFGGAHPRYYTASWENPSQVWLNPDIYKNSWYEGKGPNRYVENWGTKIIGDPLQGQLGLDTKMRTGGPTGASPTYVPFDLGALMWDSDTAGVWKGGELDQSLYYNRAFKSTPDYRTPTFGSY